MLAGGTLLRGLATLATVLVGFALVLYAVEEVVPLPQVIPRRRRPCAVTCWERAGSSISVCRSSSVFITGPNSLEARS